MNLNTNGLFWWSSLSYCPFNENTQHAEALASLLTRCKTRVVQNIRWYYANWNMICVQLSHTARGMRCFQKVRQVVLREDVSSFVFCFTHCIQRWTECMLVSSSVAFGLWLDYARLARFVLLEFSWALWALDRHSCFLLYNLFSIGSLSVH